MFYYDDHRLKQYYAIYKGQFFKTEEEYLNHLAEQGIEPEDIQLPRFWKYGRKIEEYPLCDYKTFKAAPGTEFPDERDLSGYYVADQKAAEELLTSYYDYPDGFADKALFVSGNPEDSFVLYHATNAPIPEFNPEEENKEFAYFIISYYPDDEHLRSIRKNVHQLQLDHIRKLAPNTKIYIIAQNYHEDDYVDDPRIIYDKRKKCGNAAIARNECLKWFYGTDYNWGIFSDDDVFLRETESARNFYYELEHYPEKFINKIDVIQTRYMMYEPIRMDDLQNAENFSKAWQLTPVTEGQFHNCFIKNFKKFYDKEYYCENIEAAKCEGFDDNEFFFLLNKEGLHIYKERSLFRMLGCTCDCDSVCQDVSISNYLTESLCATRRRYTTRNSNGSWDFTSPSAHTPYLSIPKECIDDYYGELDFWPRAADMKRDFEVQRAAYRRF